MMSSVVQLGKGRHFDAPNMAYVFGGQGLHWFWPESSEKREKYIHQMWPRGSISSHLKAGRNNGNLKTSKQMMQTE